MNTETTTTNGAAHSFSSAQVKTLALICAAAGILIGGVAGIALGLHLGLATAQEVRDLYEKSLAENNQVYQSAAENKLEFLVGPKDAGK